MKIGPENRRRIAESIREKYVKAAASPEGLFRYPTGRAGLLGLGYDAAVLAGLPEAIQESFCGVGNPFAPGRPEAGWTVLDAGCGAGVDAILAASLVGAAGRALGLDASPDMLDRARRNAALAGTANASFAQADLEHLPLAGASFDLIVSNGALNLVVDKDKALAEMFRVLVPGGRLQIADQILTGPPPLSEAEAAASWFR